jgi:phage shock protein C
MTEPVRRLYRSETERMLGGVCGGLAEYAGVDPTLIRVLMVALTFFGGAGIPIYLVMWILVPSQSKIGTAPGDVARSGVEEMKERARWGSQQLRRPHREEPQSPHDDRREEPTTG